MVHVGMGDENLSDLQELAGRHSSEPTEIELQGAPLPPERDKKAGVAKWPVYQARCECSFHFSSNLDREARRVNHSGH
jgi:hypothetical protein